VLHFTGGNEYLTYVTPVLAKLFRVRKVLRIIHGLHIPPLHNGREWALSLFDFILCVSDASLASFRESGYRAENLRRHYLGLIGKRNNTEKLRGELRKKFQFSASTIVLGTIVFDEPVKGLDVLIRSFALLRKRVENVELLVIGVNPDTSENAKLAIELGVENGMHWTSIRDEGWRFLFAADIYVQPSRSEGLGLAILEAMSIKLPVVASKVGGIVELIKHGETGLLVPPNDEFLLAEAIEALSIDPSLRSAFGQAGQRMCADRFDGERSASELLTDFCGIRSE
jgi:glycosyltransferase involved in cell wall biosynthesis